jgi:DNA modification methylase
MDTKNKIILGDCKEILKSFPSEFIDLIVTSLEE